MSSPNVGCLTLSGLDEISEVVFEAGRSLNEKAEQEKKSCRMYTFSWGRLLEVKM